MKKGRQYRYCEYYMVIYTEIPEKITGQTFGTNTNCIRMVGTN